MGSVFQYFSAIAALGLSVGGALAQDAPAASARQSWAVTFRMSPEELSVRARVQARLEADLEVVGVFRPAYSFWQHLFAIPDGRIVLGSAQDGRLLATLPQQGAWDQPSAWEDESLRAIVVGQVLPTRLDD
ncbi:MAG TPA: hypothetical protein VIY56_04210, partial [Vicinamibacterales bacterium]